MFLLFSCRLLPAVFMRVFFCGCDVFLVRLSTRVLFATNARCVRVQGGVDEDSDKDDEPFTPPTPGTPLFAALAHRMAGNAFKRVSVIVSGTVNGVMVSGATLQADSVFLF